MVNVKTPVQRRLVEWLLACPEKGYFVPIASDSTDSLVPGRRAGTEGAPAVHPRRRSSGATGGPSRKPCA